MTHTLRLGVVAILAFATAADAQRTNGAPTGPAENVEQVTDDAQRARQSAILNIDRPIYEAIQQNKRELSEKYGFTYALENTLIYQAASGGVDPNDAMVNTLGLFATWKIFRDPNGKDFAGLGFQFETRSNHIDEFTDLRNDLGTLWSPNDSTSGSYSKINQLWWGQRFAEGRFGLQVGKIDPGANINANRFAGSGNTQFFGQPFATNPARSFPDNGLGFMLRAEPSEQLYFHFTMADSDAVSTHSPFTTISGHWLYAGEAGYRPTIEGLGPGNYRVMLYQRDATTASEFGWSISADQNLCDDLGVFLRYGGNDGDINAIRHLISGGVSFLHPFGRKDDQAGIGVSYTHPTDRDLRDQYSTEAFYRLQLTAGIDVSGSAQLIVNPAASDQDTVAVFGIRIRLLY